MDTRSAQGFHCLNDGWWVRSSAQLELGGAAISRPAPRDAAWHRASLPATALGTLVESGVIVDPFFGTNLKSIPGHGPPAQNFSNHPMPEDSPFRASWWFVKEFRVPADTGEFLSLQLDGINYRANVWLNGQKLADTKQVVGAYRVHELDVTRVVDRNGPNVLAIEVFPPDKCDLAITWVDWNPSPPDKNLGLWRDVWLRSSGPVAVRDPYVLTRLDDDGQAFVTVAVDVINHSEIPQLAELAAELDGRKLSTTLNLGPGERRRVELTPEAFPELVFREPRLWWPRVLGEPALHQLAVSASVDGKPSDAAEVAVGLRDVRMLLNERGHAQYYVNGVAVQIRGAGWAPDLFLRRQPARERAQLEYVKALHLNTIRFEGMLERAEFLEQCDRDGIMVIAGWCCCDQWEKWAEWKDENHHVSAESLKSQLRRARRHPSVISWWYGSDFAPPPMVEQRYLDVIKDVGWPNPHHSSAANKPTELTGKSGLKMEGPYEYVPPNYWLEDTVRGGAFGFATEISPGPAVPPLESLKKMIPADHLWPIDDVWRFHAGGQEFHQVKFFSEALEKRYGAVSGVDEYCQLAQIMTYEAERAMFEGYTQRKGVATGVIQWMLNNSWPSLIWHLFDYFLRPGGGFFGTMKACEPLHVMYDASERAVLVTNERNRGFQDLSVEARVLDLHGKEHFHATHSLDVGAGEVVRALSIPGLSGLEPLHFVDLRLTSASGELVSRNFYWIPAVPDVLDHEKMSWMHTPIQAYADLSALRELPTSTVSVRATPAAHDKAHSLSVEVHNPSDKLAFFVQLRLEDGRGEDVLPLLWSDNYVSLLPGERRHIDVKVLSPKGLPADARLEVRGLNVARLRVIPERLRGAAEARDTVTAT